MGDELWRRSLRTTVGPSVMAWLALVGVYVAVRSQWTWTRSASLAAVALFAFAAIEAWRAELVVGTEGIAVRRTFTRFVLPWASISDFAAIARGRRAGVEVVLTTGETRSLLDWPVDAQRGMALVVELKSELTRHRP
jgi:hypothetical protein